MREEERKDLIRRLESIAEFLGFFQQADVDAAIDELKRLWAIEREVSETLRPFAEVADAFDWVKDTMLDGSWVWAQHSNIPGHRAPCISVRDVRAARDIYRRIKS